MTRAKFQKRLGQPVPQPLTHLGVFPPGCLLPLLVPALLSVLLFRRGWWPLALPLAFFAVGLFAHWAAARQQTASAAAQLRAEGKRGVLVYSNSPVWESHITREWLPRLGDQLVVLNWSQRARWSDTAAVRLWRQLSGPRNFNPVVLLLPDAGPPLRFAFYPWFQAAKHGDRAGLAALEAELFARLDASTLAEK